MQPPRRARSVLLVTTAALVFTAVPTPAQELDRATPVLDLPEDEYPATPISVGPAQVRINADANLEYDDNIYARPSNRIDDFKLMLAPRISATIDQGSYRVIGRAELKFRQYFDNTSENSTSALVGANAVWLPTATDRFAAGANWQRLTEDRGDPEARQTVGTGPRLIDATTGELGYERRGSRFGFRVRGSATRFDHVDRLDAERDHDNYAASARLGYRAGGLVSGFGDAFVNYRDFRTATDLSGIKRDAATYGGRVGVEIDPGGTFRGDAAIGLFRFDPSDASLASRTGVSAQIAMIYQPTRRLAFTLDGFRGDVATVRNGAQSRVDTRFRLGVQQEARRNLRWQTGLIYRRSNFVGSDTRERTLGGFAEVEYLINRRFAIVGFARYADRNSSRPGDQFERLRGGIELRVQY